MDFRNQVKQALRHFGHAIVSTIHDRLNGVETQLNALTAQTADMRETQTAIVSTIHSRLNSVDMQLHTVTAQTADASETQTTLLQSEIYVVELLRQWQTDLQQQQEQLSRQNKDLKQQVESLQSSVASSEDSQAALMQSSIHLVESLNQTHSELRQQVEHVRKQIAGAEQAQESLRQELRGAIDQQSHLQADHTSRTTEVLRQMHVLLEAGANSDEAQGSLLQTGVQLIDCLKQDQRLLQQQGDVFRQQFAQLIEQHERIADSTRQVFQQVLGLQNYTQNVFDQELVRQVCVETSDYGVVNPETGLMEFLYSFLPTPKAVDIGAHVGDVSMRLLKAGYEVFAFEPYPPSYKKLTRRLAKQRKFHPHNFALGSLEGELPLHLAKDQSAASIYEDATIFSSLAAHSMPDDLPFVKTVLVPVKDLAGLHRSGTLPADISLVKIDTEGYDLEVIRGMQDFRYPVVLAEFWDREIPFGKSGLLYTLDSLIEEMRVRGYGWHIVIYRIWGLNQRAFYCNHDRSVPGSWGNIAFFRNYDLFAQAQTWCSATLPRTFFKPARVH